MRNKSSNLYKGVLENAGLGETAFYLKKAKTYLSYAEYALDNTDFESVVSKSKSLHQKIEGIKQLILELDDGIDSLGNELVEEIGNREEVE